MDVIADAVTVHRAAAAAGLPDDEGPGGSSLAGVLRHASSSGASALMAAAGAAASGGATPRQGAAAAAPALPVGGGSPNGAVGAGGGGHVSWAPGLEQEEEVPLAPACPHAYSAHRPDSLQSLACFPPARALPPQDLFAPAASTREQQPIISAGSVGVTQDPLAPAGAPAGVVYWHAQP